MDLVQTFFNWEVLVRTFPMLLQGLGMTLMLGFLSILLGLIGGLGLALLRSDRLRHQVDVDQARLPSCN